MQPKINVQKCLNNIFAQIGGGIVIGLVGVILHKHVLPYLSWGSNLCKICDQYKCTTYNDLCDYCAKDVREEFTDCEEGDCNEDVKAKTNLSMYN